MSHWSSNEQLVCGPTSKPNPSQANERVGPLVQDLESVLKGITSLLSLKVGRTEFHLAPHVPSYSPSLTPEMGGLLSRRTRATLTHANLRIILNKQEFIVSLGLKSSYLGHRMKRKSVSTVNDIIKWELFSSWFDLMQYSLHRTPPLTCLHMYNLVITLFISYTKWVASIVSPGWIITNMSFCSNSEPPDWSRAQNSLNIKIKLLITSKIGHDLEHSQIIKYNVSNSNWKSVAHWSSERIFLTIFLENSISKSRRFLRFQRR